MDVHNIMRAVKREFQRKILKSNRKKVTVTISHKRYQLPHSPLYYAGCQGNFKEKSEFECLSWYPCTDYDLETKDALKR